MNPIRKSRKRERNMDGQEKRKKRSSKDILTAILFITGIVSAIFLYKNLNTNIKPVDICVSTQRKETYKWVNDIINERREFHEPGDPEIHVLKRIQNENTLYEGEDIDALKSGCNFLLVSSIDEFMRVKHRTYTPRIYTNSRIESIEDAKKKLAYDNLTLGTPIVIIVNGTEESYKSHNINTPGLEVGDAEQNFATFINYNYRFLTDSYKINKVNPLTSYNIKKQNTNKDYYEKMFLDTNLKIKKEK